MIPAKAKPKLMFSPPAPPSQPLAPSTAIAHDKLLATTVPVPHIRITPHSRNASSSSAHSATSFSAVPTPVSPIHVSSSSPPLTSKSTHKSHLHNRRPSLADAVLDARRGAGARLKRAANKLKHWGSGAGGSAGSVGGPARRRGRRSSLSSAASSTAHPSITPTQLSGRLDTSVPLAMEEDWIEDDDEDEEDDDDGEQADHGNYAAYSHLFPFEEDDADNDDRDDSDGWSASVHSSRHGSADMDLPWTPRALRGPPPQDLAFRPPPPKPLRSATAPTVSSRRPDVLESPSLPNIPSSFPMHPLSQVRSAGSKPSSQRVLASPVQSPVSTSGRMHGVHIEDEEHRAPTTDAVHATRRVNDTTTLTLSPAPASPTANTPDVALLPRVDTRATHLSAFSHTNPMDVWLADPVRGHTHHLARRWLLAHTSIVTGTTLGHVVVDVSALGVDVAQVPPEWEHLARTAFEGLLVEDDDPLGRAPVIVSDAPLFVLETKAQGPAVDLSFVRAGDLIQVAVLDIGRLARGPSVRKAGNSHFSDLAVQVVVESGSGPPLVLVAPHLRAKELFVQYVGFAKLQRDQPLMDDEAFSSLDQDDEFLADAYHALNDLVAAEHDVACRYQQVQESLSAHQSTLAHLTSTLADLHLAASGLVVDAQGECRVLPGSLGTDLDAHATAVDAHQEHFVTRVRNRAKVLAAYQVQALAALDKAEAARAKAGRGVGEKGPWIARVAVGLVVVVALVRLVNPWGVFSEHARAVSDNMTVHVGSGTGEANRPVPPGAWRPAPAPPGHVVSPSSSPHAGSNARSSHVPDGESKVAVVTIVREIYYSAAPVTVAAIATPTPNADEDGTRSVQQGKAKGRWWQRIW